MTHRRLSAKTLFAPRNFLVPLAALVAVTILAAGTGQASAPSISVTIASPTNGQTISGAVSWQARVQGAVERVVFSVDGVQQWSLRAAPYGGTLDTTPLANGFHVLGVVAYAPGHRTASDRIAVNVQNRVTPPPPPPAPQSQTPPALSGTASAGQTLSASTGTWTNSPMAYAYAWQRCATNGGACAAIGGAAASTYAATTADVGSTLRVTVTATNAGGSGVATSAASAVVQPAPVVRAPQVLSPPAITGKTVVGQTLTTTYGTWVNGPSAFAVAWQRCNTTGGACVAIAGATSTSYQAASGDAGSTLRVTVTASNVGGSGLGVSTATTVVQSPPTPAPGGAPVWPSTTPPPFTPNRVATTVTQFNQIMGSLQPGDVVEVKPMTLTGEVVFGQKLSSPADIYFDQGVTFTGTAAGTQLPAVWIHGSNLRLYGGDVSGMGNDCVKVSAASADTSGPTNIRWWGAMLHDCGGNGFSAQGANYPNASLDIAAEVWNAGQNLALDPHAVKGTGLHGAYIGGGNAPTSGRFLFYVHDQPTGAGLQIGANLQNADVWLKVDRLTFQNPTPCLGGNALQLWGGANNNVVVRDLEVSNITGRSIETTSLTGGSGNSVQYARTTNAGSSLVYEPSQFVSFGNVS